MTESFKDELVNLFQYAIRHEYNYIAVLVYFEDTQMTEIIINSRENFEYKLDYYHKTYDKDLFHRHAKGIRLIDFLAINSLSEVEEYLT